MSKNENFNSSEDLNNTLVWSPENPRSAEIMAQALLEILTSVYGHHNLTDSRKQLTTQIRNGVIKPWIKVSISGIPLACAALIDHQDKVEIGRAANHFANGGQGGGHLMEKACNWHQKEDNRLLVAEIRMASDFENIAGGQGSQHVLLSKLGFTPHAFLPAFHHPGPSGLDRQELFCFSALDNKNEIGKFPHNTQKPKLFLPINTLKKFGNDLEFLLSKQSSGLHEIVLIDIPTTKSTKVSTSFNGIFHEIILDPSGISLQKALHKLSENQDFRFVLAQFNQKSTEDILAQNELSHLGAAFLGFNFSQPKPNTFWGFISKNITLAPSECASSLPNQIKSFVNKVENHLEERKL